MLRNPKTEQSMVNSIAWSVRAADSAARTWHNTLWMINDINYYNAQQSVRTAAYALHSSYYLTQALLGVSLNLTCSTLLTWQTLLQAASIRLVENMQPPREKAERAQADASFYFRGPDGRHNLRVDNLEEFVRIARQVDDETWLYHLHRGDYSHWCRTGRYAHACARYD